jgi:hypothetical protein
VEAIHTLNWTTLSDSIKRSNLSVAIREPYGKAHDPVAVKVAEYPVAVSAMSAVEYPAKLDGKKQ